MRTVSLMAVLLAPGLVAAEVPRTLRVDYYHTGSSTQELFALDRLILEPLPWPGNPQRPLDELDLGTYFFEVRDRDSQKKLYSRGFCSIYGEWVTTAEAKNTTRTFHESLRLPMPSAPVDITLRKRDKDNAWRDVWSLAVDPRDPWLDSSVPAGPGELIEIEKNGPSPAKVDLVILGDGYTSAERKKFEDDARRMTQRLLDTAPFKERRRDFNIWALCPAAQESGVSRPAAGIHRAAPLGSTYDVFGSERYVLTFENRAFRRIASFAPYDAAAILVNSSTYGGGGIFGQYTTTAAGSGYAAYVFVHELGHHFAGLADEYFTSPVAYLPPQRRVEPWEPNVTALLDPHKLRWRELAAPGIPLPTPWAREDYETRAREIQKRRAALRKEGKPEADIEALFAEERRVMERMLGDEKFAGKVGAFEGAMYESRGYYRPEVNCIMFTRTDFFCAVCRRAIERVIDQYTATR